MSDALLLNEHWCQSYVGIAINERLREQYGYHDDAFVTFETSVAWIEKYTAARRRGRKPGNLTDRQRFEILVWSKGGVPAGIVEVKDDPVMQAYFCQADPKKLEAALKRWAEIRWGIFLFSVRPRLSVTNPKCRLRLAEKRDKVFHHAAMAVQCNTLEKASREVPDEPLMWCGMGFGR